MSPPPSSGSSQSRVTIQPSELAVKFTGVGTMIGANGVTVTVFEASEVPPS